MIWRVFAFVLIGFIASTASASATSPSLVRVALSDGASFSFAPFADALPGTIGSIASGDFGGDGIDELLVGAGAGMQPSVAILRQDGSTIRSFLAYDAAFMHGVNVAACDFSGDGVYEIVTGAKFGGGPHVRVFDAMGNPREGFFAYASDFRGGVYVACGDLDGDGIDEIVTGAGLSGGPHIKVFTADGYLVAEVFNGSAAENFGSIVAVKNGVVLATPVGGGDDTVRAFTLDRGELTPQSTIVDMTRDAIMTITTLKNGATATAEITTDLFHDTSARYIVIDISDQRLTAYAYGIEANSFLISSGVYGYDTPYGKFSVLAKLPVHVYSGTNYYYPNVQWNLRFKPRYYIHTAYWHNNFGHRMSHGCINTRLEDADWIYHWADVGTPVEIIP